MSKRLDVLQAVKALVAAALPGVDVKGLDNEAPRPARISPTGLAIVRDGSPGEPDVDLSPVRYHYDHTIPLEVTANGSPNKSAATALDELLASLGAAIAADRQLGGLVNWLDVYEPDVDDIVGEGTGTSKGAELAIIASYSTDTPLN